eukprot:m.177745 g.177745  ORF g.177745 m.177745 type:complete len:71 (-) comp17970_c0_seq2:3020-3232(-)
MAVVRLPAVDMIAVEGIVAVAGNRPTVADNLLAVAGSLAVDSPAVTDGTQQSSVVGTAQQTVQAATPTTC